MVTRPGGLTRRGFYRRAAITLAVLIAYAIFAAILLGGSWIGYFMVGGLCFIGGWGVAPRTLGGFDGQLPLKSEQVWIVHGWFGSDEWVEGVYATEEAADARVAELWKTRGGDNGPAYARGLQKFGAESYPLHGAQDGER